RGGFGHGNGGSRRERLPFHVHIFDVGLRLLCLCGRALGIGGGIRSGGRGCLRLIAGGLGICLCVACLGRSCLCSSSTPSGLGGCCFSLSAGCFGCRFRGLCGGLGRNSGIFSTGCLPRRCLRLL